MSLASFIVPPKFMASIYGYSAAKITARKVHLLDADGKTVLSRTYSHVHQVGGLGFAGLIHFVEEKLK